MCPPKMCPSQTDEALIRAIACGNSAAMRALFDRHRGKVFRFLQRLVRSEASAEELTSEVFLEIWRNAGRFEGRSAVATWILAIARFKALSLLRREREYELDEVTAAALPDYADGPELVLQQKDRGKILRTFLGRLSLDHRQVIDLIYYHDKSIDEVAQIVNIPVNTVKTRMFYARKRLARELAQAGMQPEFL
jgi:RNA polymerase sigma-70 factor (ECF subfamily)